MLRIGLLSDTHGFLDDAVFKHFEQCDEIWHAGDFGSFSIAESLQNFKPLVGVFGNIDGPDIRREFPEEIIFQREEIKIFMKHIGGYPPKYTPQVKPVIASQRPNLFVCGHSHILKIMYDDRLKCLHINPGAAGLQGWHKVRTLVRFVIVGNEMKNCEVIELKGRRQAAL
ncbi:MAG TPA: metallophosphoesterase family protein [Chitinophagaceae bacterium]|nr:metallophosphoesterase family protein [Chitinophagaceae bacterium]